MPSSRKVMHYEIEYYLNTTPGVTTPTYNLLNEGITALPKSYNPNMVESHYIAEEQPRQNLQNFAVSWALDNEVFVGDPVGDYLTELAFKEATGSDVITEMIEVHNYFADNTPTSKRAKKRPVSVAIDSTNVTGGEPLSGSTTVASAGDIVFGTWNPTTKSFTPTP